MTTSTPNVSPLNSFRNCSHGEDKRHECTNGHDFVVQETEGPFIFEPSILLPDENLSEGNYRRDDFNKRQEDNLNLDNDKNLCFHSQHSDHNLFTSFYQTQPLQNCSPSTRYLSFYSTAHKPPHFEFETNVFQSSSCVESIPTLNTQHCSFPQQQYNDQTQQNCCESSLPSCAEELFPCFCGCSHFNPSENLQNTFAFIEKPLQYYYNTNFNSCSQFQLTSQTENPLENQESISSCLNSFSQSLAFTPPPPPFQHQNTLPTNSPTNKITPNSTRKSLKKSKNENGKKRKRTYKKRKHLWETWMSSVIVGEGLDGSSDGKLTGLNQETSGKFSTPIKCPLLSCEKMFVKVDELNRHLKTHAGFKPFKSVSEN